MEHGTYENKFNIKTEFLENIYKLAHHAELLQDSEPSEC